MSEKRYSLKFTQKAYEDLNEIFSYISETLSNQTAVKSILVCNFLGNTFASPRFRASHFLNSIISKRLCRESRVDW
jgi:hypothetical protein